MGLDMVSEGKLTVKGFRGLRKIKKPNEENGLSGSVMIDLKVVRFMLLIMEDTFLGSNHVKRNDLCFGVKSNKF